MNQTNTSPNAAVQKKHLFLIDGYGFVFRAYHSLPPLTRPDGTPVGAVYGFTNMLMRLKSRASAENNDYMLVVFDAGRKTFRNDIYPEYKAHRPPAPEDLVPQFPIVKQAAQALGLPTSSLVGYEADDIIATYTKLAKEKGFSVTIISSDKDLMQLVDDDVEMFDSMKNKRISTAEVKEKFDVEPKQVLDVLALMGDSSDNIPGVPGIGAKTAAMLINQYGSLDKILANAHEIKQNKRRQSLIDFADQARLSRELATLCEDVPVDVDLEKFKIREECPQEITEFLAQQGFKSLLTKFKNKHGIIANDAAQQKITPKVKKDDSAKSFNVVYDKESLDNWLINIKLKGKLSLFPIIQKSVLIGLALAKSSSEAIYIPLSHKKITKQHDLLMDSSEDNDALQQISRSELQKSLKTPLSDPSILKIGHDIKSLIKELELHNIAPIDDSLIMSYTLDGSRHKHDLINLLQLHIGTDLSFIQDYSKVNIAETPPEDILQLAAIQATEVVALQHFFRQRLFNEKMLTVYETIDRPLIPLLSDMERVGIKADIVQLNDLSSDFLKRIADIEQIIYRLAGEEFNIASPKQLGEILFVNMNIEGGKKSKTGAYTTGADILENLSLNGHPIADEILKFRELSKLKSTYTDALAKQINSTTGRIHTSFNMASTSTGRLSSNNPNLQNIPVRSEEGKKIRKSFIAKSGYKLISADYSQIELRLLAHMAEIDSLRQAFREEKDIHSLTASQVFGVALGDVSPEMRRNAKAINFGIIYGQSAFGLAKQLGISRSDAKAYIETYFEQYPGIRKFMDSTKEFAAAHEYVTTFYGRKCFINGINDKNGAVRAFAQRAAINAPLQGTGADIIKKAMIQIARKLKKINADACIILQVHDELIIEAKEDQAEKVAKLLVTEMQNIAQLSIPLTVEANIGDNWADIH